MSMKANRRSRRNDSHTGAGRSGIVAGIIAGAIEGAERELRAPGVLDDEEAGAALDEFMWILDGQYRDDDDEQRPPPRYWRDGDGRIEPDDPEGS